MKSSRQADRGPWTEGELLAFGITQQLRIIAHWWVSLREMQEDFDHMLPRKGPSNE